MTTLSKAEKITSETLTTSLSVGAFKGGDQTFGDMVVVSGYARKFSERLIGGEDSDEDDIKYEVEMTVGPVWRAIFDVSPVVTRSGFYHSDPDEDDADGYEITKCEWSLVETDEGKKIRLRTNLRVRGSDSHEITSLAFQLTAIGDLMK